MEEDAQDCLVHEANQLKCVRRSPAHIICISQCNANKVAQTCAIVARGVDAQALDAHAGFASRG